MRCNICKFACEDELVDEFFYWDKSSRAWHSTCKQCQMYMQHSRKDERSARDRERRKEKKSHVYEHYCQGTPRCQCCGETEIKFLSLDHVNNDGAKHRRELGKNVDHMYDWIIRNGFPPMFQVLYFNCNYAKSAYGRCPHEEQ
jgi:hypothetical protein